MKKSLTSFFPQIWFNSEVDELITQSPAVVIPASAEIEHIKINKAPTRPNTSNNLNTQDIAVIADNRINLEQRGPEIAADLNDQTDKIDFLERKIALLELLLQAKNVRISEQAKLINSNPAQSPVETPLEATDTDADADTDTDTAARFTLLAPTQTLTATAQSAQDLCESRLVAASFIHAERLYLDKLLQLEMQLAQTLLLDKAQVLFPSDAQSLARSFLRMQNMLGLGQETVEPEKTLQALQMRLEESEEVIRLQHERIEETGSFCGPLPSGPAPRTTMEHCRHIMELVRGQTSPGFLKSELGVALLRALSATEDEAEKEGELIRLLRDRLDQQMALNLQIKNLLVESKSGNENNGLTIELIQHVQDLQFENDFLKKQLENLQHASLIL